jgi:hypothetical protein
MSNKRAARLQGSHLAVAHDQHVPADEGTHRRFIGPNVQGVVSPVTGYRLTAEWQAERIQGGKHGLELGEIRPIILAVATLQQGTVAKWIMIDAYGCTVANIV